MYTLLDRQSFGLQHDALPLANGLSPINDDRLRRSFLFWQFPLVLLLVYPAILILGFLESILDKIQEMFPGLEEMKEG